MHVLLRTSEPPFLRPSITVKGTRVASHIFPQLLTTSVVKTRDTFRITFDAVFRVIFYDCRLTESYHPLSVLRCLLLHRLDYILFVLSSRTSKQCFSAEIRMSTCSTNITCFEFNSWRKLEDNNPQKQVSSQVSILQHIFPSIWTTSQASYYHDGCHKATIRTNDNRP